MADGDPGQRNLDIAVRWQERFEVYFLGLTFTLLAAAIQTAVTGRVLSADLLEWVGWLALLAAGLLGLWRMERRPNWYNMAAATHAAHANVATIQGHLLAGGVAEGVGLQSGTPIDLPAFTAAQQKQAAIGEAHLAATSHRQVVVYRIQKAAFVVGIASIITARITPAAALWLKAS